MSERLKAWCSLMRLERPIGALLLLWPTLWALWLAGRGQPDAKLVVIFVAGTFVMRSAGCVINDYADREFDGDVKRTSERPLATGVVSEKEALILAAVLALIAFVLVLFTNLLTIVLSVVGVLIAAVYPFLKRYTHLPQAWLGIAFSWGIPMAYAAQTGTLPAECWLLLVANLFWVFAYDTIYAMVDRDDDIKIGVKSTAILFGNADRWVVLGCHVIALILLFVMGSLAALNGWYSFALVLATGFVAWEARLYFTRERDRCFQAFLNNTWFGATVFSGVVLGFLP